MKTRILALAALLALSPLPALAQGAGGLTLPENTVLGRLGAGQGPGPAQAIPISTLAGRMLINGASCPTTTAQRYQWFANTASSPTSTAISIFDGTSCVQIGILNESAHTFTFATTPATLVVGTTTISGGTSGRVLYDNAGVLGETASPSLGTSITVPLVIGGTTAASTLTLESTSGTGTTDYISFKTGSQSERLRIFSTGGAYLGNSPSDPGNSNLLVGGTITAPVMVGTTSVTAPTITATTLLKVNPNAGTVTNPSSVQLQVTNVDASNAGFEIAAFGNGPVQFFRRANGTSNVPTTLTSGNPIGLLTAGGYNGTTYVQNSAFILFAAAETWSGTAKGSYFTFATTPTTTTTEAEAMRVQASGGISVGTTVDGGIGTLLAKNAVKAGIAGTAQGTVTLSGLTAGTVTIGVQANFSSYNWNLPTSAGTSGTPLLSGGGASTAMSFSSILYATSATSGGVACFTSTTQMASSSALTAGAPVIGGGAGVCPSVLSLTTGDLLYASGTNTLAALADVATGRLLVSGGVGVAPAWSATPTINTSLAIAGCTISSNAFCATGTAAISGNTTVGTLNSMTITTSTGTFTLTNGKTLSVLKTLSFDGTDSTTMTFPTTSKTIAANDLTNTAVANGGALFDSNSNELIKFAVTGSAVNEITVTNNSTGNKPLISATGGDTNIILRLAGKGTGGVALLGTSTNDDAAAGDIGEVISSFVTSGSAVALSTGAAKTVTSISLTAGDWTVCGFVYFIANGSTLTRAIGSVSPTNDTLSTLASIADGYGAWVGSSTVPPQIQAGCYRKSVSGTTTMYAVAFSDFSGGSGATAFGGLWARRPR